MKKCSSLSVLNRCVCLRLKFCGVCFGNKPTVNPIISKHQPKQHKALNGRAAFSLVEMLMALLIASLLLAALAPVMTKRFSENVVVSGAMGPIDTVKKTLEIEYNSDICSDIKTDSADNSVYCEGEFEVPEKINGGLKITVIGAGGGGGVAPTAGYTEYTTAGSTNTFTVPSMTGNIEATLISGGAGGGAGGQVLKTQTFVTYGNGNMVADSNNVVTVNTSGTGSWTIPEAVRGRNLLGSACGGGGGGGGASGTWKEIAGSIGGGGGSGAYILNKVMNFGSNSSVTYYIGGGGGGGFGPYNINTTCLVTGQTYGGGGGGTGGGSQGLVNAGALVTASTIGGKGGSGHPNGVQPHSTVPYSVYTNGGDGGQPGGGEGASIHWGGCAAGGGGGGGGASQIVTGSTIHLNAPGGGGGSGYQRTAIVDACPANTVAGGGGGGGTGGGDGGGLNSNPGKGGLPNGVNGSGVAGGRIDTIFGSGVYCDGRDGGLQGNSWTTGIHGASGAIRLAYLDYGPGGSGGGGAHIVPIQQVKINPMDVISIKLGSGAAGGTAGAINTNATISNPTIGQSAYTNVGPLITKISKDSTVLLSTPNNGNYGLFGGSPTGVIEVGGLYTGVHGVITNGLLNSMQGISVAGFSNTGGKSANNGTTLGNITYPNGSTGGDGGTTTTPFTRTCTPGRGGTSSSPNGGNASGYGCGGGGGYGLANGGMGSGGYARISWNKYWDTASNAYKLASVGAAGGGASGNIFKYSITPRKGEMIKFRIGKGGDGAYVSNNTVINAKKGGDTSFGDVKAGGGNPGSNVTTNPSYNPSSPISNTNNPLINGIGGMPSNICSNGIKSFINDRSKCTQGIKGNDANNATGGKGADFIGYTYEITTETKGPDGTITLTKTKKTLTGTGGNGGIQGDNSNGEDSIQTNDSISSGGGGSAIRDLGQVSSSSQTNITQNPTKGGKGSHGRIILEWSEYR